MIAKLVLAFAVAYAGWWLWRGPASRSGRSAGLMTGDQRLAEARAVLGVGVDADRAEIQAAWRRIAAAVHPDHGGSAELARRVNAARDILLKHGPD